MDFSICHILTSILYYIATFQEQQIKRLSSILFGIITFQSKDMTNFNVMALSEMFTLIIEDVIFEVDDTISYKCYRVGAR